MARRLLLTGVLIALLVALGGCRHERWLLAEGVGPLDRTGAPSNIYGNLKTKPCIACVAANLVFIPLLPALPVPYVSWEASNGRHVDSRRVVQRATQWRLRFDHADLDEPIESMEHEAPLPMRKSMIVSLEPLVVVEVDAPPPWEANRYAWIGEEPNVHPGGGYLGLSRWEADTPVRWYCPDRGVAPSAMNLQRDAQIVLDTGGERFVIRQDGATWVVAREEKS